MGYSFDQLRGKILVDIFTKLKCFFKKIEIEKCDSNAVELAKESHKNFNFLTISNDHKTRKNYGVDTKGMAEMVNMILGNFIAIRVEHMILEEIVMEHGSQKMLEAYAKYQESSGIAIKGYFNEMASIRSGNEKTILQ